MATPALSLSGGNPSSTTGSWVASNWFASRLRSGPRTVSVIWSRLPTAWWIMPAAGVGLLAMLASGVGLSAFVGKYAWTGKDFQEVLGPSLLAGAVVVATFLCWLERSVCRAWLWCVPSVLLCRELHFAGTGTGIYIALAVLAIYAVRNRRCLQPIWDCHATCSLGLGAMSWYALAVTVDSGLWKFLPHSHWWSVNLEETLESGGHLAILAGVLASVLMRSGKRKADSASQL